MCGSVGTVEAAWSEDVVEDPGCKFEANSLGPAVGHQGHALSQAPGSEKAANLKKIRSGQQ
jgi:hypothetical protein